MFWPWLCYFNRFLTSKFIVLKFYKYQGTGNDFVLVDDRSGKVKLSEKQIAFLCHRRFGIGADGFILLRLHEDYDFEMAYYNSDGRQSSMCGNGGRCIARFAADLGIAGSSYRFLAIDGPHEAKVSKKEVSLKMGDVKQVDQVQDDWFADTGSPHHVQFRSAPDHMEIIKEAHGIRYSDIYAEKGVNVNFVDPGQDSIYMRTYERGVEDETFSCGTGVTAAALVSHSSGRIKKKDIKVRTKGGNLSVKFDPDGSGGYQNIWLTGPAVFVFEGEIKI